MRSLLATALVAALGLGLYVQAATPPATNAPAAKTASKPAPKSATALTPAESEAKRAACEKTWHAQTKHTGKHKAFIAACVAKG